jgi:hypothetical protein
MNLAVKVSLLASGLFILAGMLSGIVKYQKIMSSPTHSAPIYIDIAHRSAFIYGFACLVISRLLEYSPYSLTTQLIATALVLFFFVGTVIGYFITGLRNNTDNLFSERNFATTWGMYLLILGEIGGLVVILWGFIETQFLGRALIF